MQNNGKIVTKITIPPDFNFRLEPLSLKLPFAIRECNSNAENYHATEAGVWIIHHQLQDFFLYAHNGNPFVDSDDILINGCTPNNTTNQGSAFQGAGLAATAYAAHRNPKLIIASVCQDGKFRAGAGFPVPPNWWETRDETKIWKPVLEKFLGGRHLAKFKVFYLFPLSISNIHDSKKKRNFLTPDIFLQVNFLAPSSLAGDLKVFYGEKELGYPYENAAERKKYATFESAFKGDTSSARRRTLSLPGYFNRYRKDGDYFTIPCDPFKVTAQKYGNDTSLEIDKATIHVHLFDFHKPANSSAHWYVTVRSGQDSDGKFGKGKQADYGHKLARERNFLTCPWIATNVEENDGPEIAKQFARFKDNALGTYRNSAELMSALGLPYNGAGDPAVVIYVSVENVKALISEQGGVEKPDARTVMELFGRKSDFRFEASNQMHEMMKAACEAAAPHVSQELKDRCAKLFHYEMGDFLDFDFEFDFEQGPRRRRKATRQKMVEVYDMGKNGREFKGIFRAGETKQLAIWHTGLQQWIDHLDIDPSTRGVEVKLIPERRLKDYPNVKETVQWFKENDEASIGQKIPVFNVSVSKLGQIDDDGDFHPIKKSEYEHNASFVPSRKLVLLHNQDHINFWCKDVPKQKRNQNAQPPEGFKTIKFPDGSGAGRRKKTSIFNQREGSDAWFTFEPKTRLLKLNTLSQWVAYHYKTRSNALRGSTLHRELRELYLTFKAMASNLYDQFTNLNLRTEQNDGLPADYDDTFDWFLNRTLQGEIVKNPMLMDAIKKIDKQIERAGNNDELENEDVA